MNSENQPAQINYFDVDWCGSMAAQCATAQRSIHMSALSMQAPRQDAIGTWPDLWRELCAAARRGVRVDIWLPAPSPIYPASKGNQATGQRIVDEKMHVHFVTGNRLLHAKACVIDTASCWIGSGNFTAAAAHFNHESYLQTVCPVIAGRIISRLKTLA